MWYQAQWCQLCPKIHRWTQSWDDPSSLVALFGEAEPRGARPKGFIYQGCLCLQLAEGCLRGSLV